MIWKRGLMVACCLGAIDGNAVANRQEDGGDGCLLLRNIVLVELLQSQGRRPGGLDLELPLDDPLTIRSCDQTAPALSDAFAVALAATDVDILWAAVRRAIIRTSPGGNPDGESRFSPASLRWSLRHSLDQATL